MFCFIRGLDRFSLPEGSPLHIRRIADSKVFLVYNIKSDYATDSYMYQGKEKLACFDGVLVNSIVLMNTYALPSTESLLESVLFQEATSLLERFHGQFSGMAYNPKGDGQGFFFTNQTGSARLYYWQENHKVVVSTSLSILVAILRMNGIIPSLDVVGTKMLLSIGFTLADYTTIDGVRLLEPGHYIRLSGNQLQINKYHSFNNAILHNNLHIITPILNELFREAIDMEYSWDKQHGKSHLAFLSGGLDSRMAVFTASSLGYGSSMHCLNFSQTGYLDHSIAKNIADILGISYHFYALDKGEYLLDIPRGILYNDGQIIYHGSAHLDAAIRSISTKPFGVLHSGQVGDLILGSFLLEPRHSPAGIQSIGLELDNMLGIDFEIRRIASKYPNHELFALYNRAFNAASNGDLASALQNHAISPFLYPPFAQYCLNIDPAVRWHNQLYLEWFRTSQPQAYNIRWEKTGLPLSAGTQYRQAAMLIKRTKAKLAKWGLGSTSSMNPFELWFKENSTLANKMNLMFSHADKENIISASDAGTLYRKVLVSPNIHFRIQAFTAAHSLTMLLGGTTPWIPDDFPGGF